MPINFNIFLKLLFLHHVSLAVRHNCRTLIVKLLVERSAVILFPPRDRCIRLLLQASRRQITTIFCPSLLLSFTYRFSTLMATTASVTPAIYIRFICRRCLLLGIMEHSFDDDLWIIVVIAGILRSLRHSEVISIIIVIVVALEEFLENDPCLLTLGNPILV